MNSSASRRCTYALNQTRAVVECCGNALDEASFCCAEGQSCLQTVASGAWKCTTQPNYIFVPAGRGDEGLVWWPFLLVFLLLLSLICLAGWLVLRRNRPTQQKAVQPQTAAVTKPSKPLHPAAEAKRKEWAGIEPLCVTTVPQSSVLVRAKSGSLWLTSPPAVAVASPVYTIPPLPQRTERHGRPRVIPLDDLMRDAIISETGLQVECDITVVKTYSKSAAMCTDDELPSTPAAR